MNSKLQMNNQNSLLVKCILDIGEMLLKSGAEVSRVEDTMDRIGLAYGFERTNIFAISSFIVFTAQVSDGEIITQTRRIQTGEINMERLEQINGLSRQICTKIMDPEALNARIAHVKSAKEYPTVVKMFSFAIVSAAFTAFYGGTVMDSITSMLTGILLYWVIAAGNRIKIQTIILNIVCSFFTGMIAILFIQMGMGDSFDKIVIGNIMLLIPGISLMTALRDMIKGDIITGILGMCDALFRAFAVAIGFAIAMIIKGVF